MSSDPMPSTLSPQLSTAVPGKPRHWLRRLAWAFGIGLLLLFGGYLFRAPLLTGLAGAWVVNDPVTKADAIVLLGGGLENRPFAAAKLFHDGVAPQIIYMDVQAQPGRGNGRNPAGERTDTQNPVEQQRPGNGHDRDWQQCRQDL